MKVFLALFNVPLTGSLVVLLTGWTVPAWGTLSSNFFTSPEKIANNCTTSQYFKNKKNLYYKLKTVKRIDIYQGNVGAQVDVEIDVGDV